MNVFVVLEMTYDYYQFEQFVGVAKSFDGAVDIVQKYNKNGWEIVMYGEPARADGKDLRHDELVAAETPHFLIVESKLDE
jgi:hypothetical protein